MTIMDYISLAAIATGIVCVLVLFFLHDFDLEDLLYGERR